MYLEDGNIALTLRCKLMIYSMKLSDLINVPYLNLNEDVAMFLNNQSSFHMLLHCSTTKSG